MLIMQNQTAKRGVSAAHRNLRTKIAFDKKMNREDLDDVENYSSLQPKQKVTGLTAALTGIPTVQVASMYSEINS